MQSYNYYQANVRNLSTDCRSDHNIASVMNFLSVEVTLQLQRRISFSRRLNCILRKIIQPKERESVCVCVCVCMHAWVSNRDRKKIKTSNNWLMSLDKYIQVFIVFFFPLLCFWKYFQNKNLWGKTQEISHKIQSLKKDWKSSPWLAVCGAGQWPPLYQRHGVPSLPSPPALRLALLSASFTYSRDQCGL